jgi:deazaflavin-dependent oxidoreductase (nitroreductase family)
MSRACSVERDFFRMLNHLVEPHIRAGWSSPRLVPGGLIVLETRGRRTGRLSRIPLAAMRIDDHVVVSTFRRNRSQWVKNVAVNPEVRYWLRGRLRSARAHVISSAAPTSIPRALPPALRWLARSLVPYTLAGWTFAILGPDGEGIETTPRRRLPQHAPARS